MLCEASVLGDSDWNGRTVYEPGGCMYCNGRGYNGRVGLYELLAVKPEWARNISEGVGEPRIVSMMQQDGVRFLMDHAVDKLFSGHTAPSEVIAVASSW